MDAHTFFLDCPAYIGRDGAARCGLPAAVEYSYRLGSTDGALTGVKIRCPRGHWFSGPVDALTVPAAAPPEVAADAPRAGIAARVSPR
jgi:hypothetical protein